MAEVHYVPFSHRCRNLKPTHITWDTTDGFHPAADKLGFLDLEAYERTFDPRRSSGPLPPGDIQKRNIKVLQDPVWDRPPLETRPAFESHYSEQATPKRVNFPDIIEKEKLKAVEKAAAEKARRDSGEDKKKKDMQIEDVLRGFHIDTTHNGLVPCRDTWLPVDPAARQKREASRSPTLSFSSLGTPPIDPADIPLPPSPPPIKEPLPATLIGKTNTKKAFDSECDKNMDSKNCFGCNDNIECCLSYICLRPKCGHRFCASCAWLLVRAPEVGGVDGDIPALKHHWEVFHGRAREEDAPVIRVFKSMPATGAALMRRLQQRRRKEAEFEERWGRKLGE